MGGSPLLSEGRRQLRPGLSKILRFLLPTCQADCGRGGEAGCGGIGGAHAAEAAAPGCERRSPGSGDGSAAAPGTATPPPYTCAPRVQREDPERATRAGGRPGTQTYPGRVHHALGRPGRARGVHDEEGVAERQLLELQLGRWVPSASREEVVQKHTVGTRGGANRERPGRWPGLRARRDDSPGLRGTRARSRAVPRDSGEADAQIHGKSGGTASTGTKATLLRELRGPGRGRPLGARRCSKSRCRCRCRR